MLATRINPLVVFAAGSVAFAITSAIIVTLGYFLVSIIPVSLITICGGVIMIAYGAWEFFKASNELGTESSKTEKKLSTNSSKSTWAVFLSTVSILMFLDLAGDATEVLTIVFVAHFQDTFVVFSGAVCALVAASAIETLIGNRLSKFLSLKRIHVFSFLVFLIIGTLAIVTTVIHSVP